MFEPKATRDELIEAQNAGELAHTALSDRLDAVEESTAKYTRTCDEDIRLTRRLTAEIADVRTMIILLMDFYKLQVVDVPGTPEQITPAVPPSKRIEPIPQAKAAKGGK